MPGGGCIFHVDLHRGDDDWRKSNAMPQFRWQFGRRQFPLTPIPQMRLLNPKRSVEEIAAEGNPLKAGMMLRHSGIGGESRFVNCQCRKRCSSYSR